MRSMTDLPKLSRAVSHALRHEPWLYELELDGEGWTTYFRRSGGSPLIG